MGELLWTRVRRFSSATIFLEVRCQIVFQKINVAQPRTSQSATKDIQQSTTSHPVREPFPKLTKRTLSAEESARLQKWDATGLLLDYQLVRNSSQRNQEVVDLQMCISWAAESLAVALERTILIVIFIVKRSRQESGTEKCKTWRQSLPSKWVSFEKEVGIRNSNREAQCHEQ